MSPSVRYAAGVLALLGCAGCHWIFPYSQPPRDSSTSGEGNLSDRGDRSDRSVDHRSSDLFRPDRAPDACTLLCPGGKTCREIKNACPCARTGIYQLEGVTTSVYCEMERFGGGWALVGRSVPGTAQRQFGWSVDTGKVDVLSQPYSLKLPVGWSITEMLVTDYTPPAVDAVDAGAAGLVPGPEVYLFKLPNNFVSAFAAEACPVTTSTPDAGQPASAHLTALGNCGKQATATVGNCSMLSHIGHTGEAWWFWFSDFAPMNGTGLQSDVFKLAVHEPSDRDCPSACSRSGNLNGRPGLIFVR